MVRLVFIILGAGLVVAVAAGFKGGHRSCSQPTIPPKQLVATVPLQTPVGPRPFLYKDFIINPVAAYDITALVLGSRSYWFDSQSALAPIDIAVGWQQMSDSALLNQLEIWQKIRFYWWRYRVPGIDDRTVIEHSANMHLIPASHSVKRALATLPKGAVIRLRGYQVQANSRTDDGWTWKSSLTRIDTGKGACELMWVERVNQLV